MTTTTQAALILTGATVLIASGLTRTNPATVLARWMIGLRAVWLFTKEIAGGAWARRGRWGECLARARREV